MEQVMQTLPARSSRASSPTGEPWKLFFSLLPLRSFFSASSRIAPSLAAPVARRLFCTPRGPRRLQVNLRTDMRRVPTHEEFAVAHREQTVYGRAWGLDRRRPRVLLAHGWAGWGLQFSEFVQPLLDAGFEVITFDQPAHGASTGKTITLPEFARVLATMDRNFGPFHSVIGHSLGGAAAAFALSRGLRAKKAVLISAPADAEAETRRFARALWIPDSARASMQKAIEEDEGVRLAELRALTIAPQLKQPALLIHDLRDREVSVTALSEYDAWPGATVVTTEGLGHVRILRDAGVIKRVVEFVAAP
jgi:pimeloyl-ACP methyl ester carboxylesterase